MKALRWISLLIPLLAPPFSFAQVEEDLGRPFDQGRVCLVPGSSDYLDDIAHDISLLNTEPSWNTLGGTLSSHAGWTHGISLGPGGLQNYAPGQAFEDIPCPFASMDLLNGMPTAGTAEWLNFPAAAWWGKNTGAGLLQIQAPLSPAADETSASAWGGSGPSGGGWLHDHQPDFYLDASVRDASLNSDFSDKGSFTVVSKRQWLDDGSSVLQSGFLGTQTSSKDYWYLFSSDWVLKTADFQSLQLKPFVQAAKLGDETLQEGGGFLRYHFNAGGLFESQIGMGGFLDSPAHGAQGPARASGFIQNTEFVDALGMANLDLAFRLDFPDSAPSQFSAVLGARKTQGSFTFIGDYSRNEAPTDSTLIQQTDLGIRVQEKSDWSTTFQYILQCLGSQEYPGGSFSAEWDPSGLFYRVLNRSRVEFEIKELQSPSSFWFFDSSLRFVIETFQKTKFWFEGREIQNVGFLCSAGVEYQWSRELGISLAGENLGQKPYSWPDPDMILGAVFKCGLKVKL